MEQKTSFGELFRRYRKSYQYHCTQAEIAKRVGYSKETISSWEQGRRFPAYHEIPRLAQLMGVATQEVEDAIQVGYARLRLQTASEQTVFTQGVFSAAESAQLPASEQESDAMDKQRRELLRLLSATGVMLTLPQDEFAHSEILERLAKALKRPTRVDQTTLAYLESVTRKERQRFVKSEGVNWYDLFCEASRHLHVITKLLEESQPSSTYVSLCMLVSETTLLIGDILFNAGKSKAPMQYYASALEAAIEARHSTLQAVILGRMSFIPIYDDTPQKALPLVEQAQLLISSGTADVIPAWLWAVASEAYANMGDAAACTHALGMAESLVARGNDGGISMAFEEGAAQALFSPIKLLSYKGTCSIRLKQPEAAQDSLRAHLTLIDSMHVHHKSITLVDLGMTYVQQTDVREACQYASQALSLIEHTESGRVLQRMLHLRQGLDPWKHTMAVKQLDEQFASLLSSERFHVRYGHS